MGRVGWAQAAVVMGRSGGFGDVPRPSRAGHGWRAASHEWLTPWPTLPRVSRGRRALYGRRSMIGV